jgi:hypothetical protein
MCHDFVQAVGTVCQHILCRGRASSASDWVWMRQLRYYMQDGRGVAVAMAEASFQYTWEYLVGGSLMLTAGVPTHTQPDFLSVRVRVPGGFPYVAADTRCISCDTSHKLHICSLLWGCRDEDTRKCVYACLSFTGQCSQAGVHASDRQVLPDPDSGKV